MRTSLQTVIISTCWTQAEHSKNMSTIGKQQNYQHSASAYERTQDQQWSGAIISMHGNNSHEFGAAVPKKQTRTPTPTKQQYYPHHLAVSRHSCGPKDISAQRIAASISEREHWSQWRYHECDLKNHCSMPPRLNTCKLRRKLQTSFCDSSDAKLIDAIQTQAEQIAKTCQQSGSNNISSTARQHTEERRINNGVVQLFQCKGIITTNSVQQSQRSKQEHQHQRSNNIILTTLRSLDIPVGYMLLFSPYKGLQNPVVNCTL